LKYALFVCLAAACSTAHAQGASHLLRRITLAASCAASFWDYQTTAEAARYGASEQNGLLADGNSRPRLGLILGVKAGVCAASAISQETRLFGRKTGFTEMLWTGMNTSLAARFTATSLHNLSVIHVLQQQAASPMPQSPTAGQ
jgi:hypothetical protein